MAFESVAYLIVDGVAVVKAVFGELGVSECADTRFVRSIRLPKLQLRLLDSRACLSFIGLLRASKGLGQFTLDKLQAFDLRSSSFLNR